MQNFTNCASCGGELIFNPSSGQVECGKCRKGYAIEQEKCVFHKIDMTGEVKEISLGLENVRLKCNSCGASFKGQRYNMSNLCEYCGSQLVEDFEKSLSTKPDGIIPYAFDKADAKIKFDEQRKKKHFLHSGFKKAPITKIESIYIPTFLFKCSSNSDYSGVIEKTKTDSRGQSSTYTRNINGTKYWDDEQIIIECSDFLTQTTMDSINPYDLSKLYKFNKGFIMGYSVEHLNRKLADIRKQANEIHRRNIRQAIIRDYPFDRVIRLNFTTEYKSSAYSYVILPTYKITTSRNGKTYETFMNGQTGKTSKMPKSGWKITLLVLGLIAGMGLLGLLIMWLNGWQNF